MRHILIIDNFDSFTFNLAEYFERLHCKVSVYRNTIPVEEVGTINPDAIVFSPGPSVPSNAGNMLAIIDRYHTEYPMLGVCLGHQAMIEYFGGELQFIEPVHGEPSQVTHDEKTIFDGISSPFAAGRYHSLAAKMVPDCFEISAKYEDIVMAIRHKELPIEGVQFHPESVLTMQEGNGLRLIENFLETYVPKRHTIRSFLEDTIAGRLNLDEQEAFLREHTEVTAEELADAVRFLQQHMTASYNFDGAIDICGTGGSGLARINTSTIASFILAASSISVAKHGNKAASGRCGSFDLLEALNVGFNQPEEQYADHNLCFLYARELHPVMKHFAEVRRRIKKPTFFNLLGPLLHPSNLSRQLIGTAFREKMQLIVDAAKLLGRTHVVVVHGDGLDEITLTGSTDVLEYKDGEIRSYTITPKDFGLSHVSSEKIAGGSIEENTRIARAILGGDTDSAHAQLVLMNAAFVLSTFGDGDLKSAYKTVSSVVASKKAAALMEQFQLPSILAEIVENTRREVAARKKAFKTVPKSMRSFRKALQRNGRSLIAEIKKHAPSMGDAKMAESVADRGKLYEQSGAAAISVLCDAKYFHGSLDDLRKAAEATRHVPMLCKDFIVDPFQIYEARMYGADAILLIAAVLSRDELVEFLEIAHELNMDALCEVHTKEELEKVLSVGADIIGINNRNLHTFSIDLGTTISLSQDIPDEKIIVAESGLSSVEDVAKLPDSVDAMLVGTALMKAANLQEKITELIEPRQKMLKICGVRDLASVKMCEQAGVDFVGLNFVPSSRRCISFEGATEIAEASLSLYLVGIFQDQSVNEVNRIAAQYDLDFVQLSGDEPLEYVVQVERPVIKAVSVSKATDLETLLVYRDHVAYLMLDGMSPGSGVPFDHSLLDALDVPVILAGGVTADVMRQHINHPFIIGFDIASAAEHAGKTDGEKIFVLSNARS